MDAWGQSDRTRQQCELQHGLFSLPVAIRDRNALAITWNEEQSRFLRWLGRRVRVLELWDAFPGNRTRQWASTRGDQLVE